MGAVRIKTLSAELEEMGHSKGLGAALGHITRLEEEFRRVRAAFEEELSKD
jgi:hypothetical protein